MPPTQVKNRVDRKLHRKLVKKTPNYTQMMNEEVNSMMVASPVKLKKGPIIDSAATVGI